MGCYLNLKTLKWTSLGDKGKSDFNAVEGWALLPNGTILTADVLKRAQFGNLQFHNRPMGECPVDDCGFALSVAISMSAVPSLPPTHHRQDIFLGQHDKTLEGFIIYADSVPRLISFGEFESRFNNKNESTFFYFGGAHCKIYAKVKTRVMGRLARAGFHLSRTV